MKNAFPVKVTLDSITPDLKFSFTPDSGEIPSDAQYVTWTKGKTGIDFKFVALAFYEANPFSNVAVNKKANEINADDNDHTPESKRHIYSVFVKVGRTYYNSRDGKRPKPNSDGPTIRNK